MIWVSIVSDFFIGSSSDHVFIKAHVVNLIVSEMVSGAAAPHPPPHQPQPPHPPLGVTTTAVSLIVVKYER